MRRTLFALFLLAATAATHAADGARVGIGVETASGRYRTASKTRIDSLPVTVSGTRGAWSFKGSLPYVRVEGDANVVPGLGAVSNLNPVGRGRTGIPILDPSPGSEPAPTRGRASGVGDLRLATTYLVGGRKAGVGVTANAKIATADDDKGLGTGANDYGTAVDAYRNVGAATVFGGVGYTRFGQSRHIDVDSAANAIAGVSVAAGRGRVGVQYDWRGAVSAANEARRDATGVYSRPIGASEVQVFASKGMSDGSPDWGAGVGVSFGF